jgi:hypothetical protein
MSARPIEIPVTLVQVTYRKGIETGKPCRRLTFRSSQADYILCPDRVH